jgi:hypothetical protein
LDGGDEFVEFAGFGSELLTAVAGEFVEADFALGVGDPPVGAQPAFEEHAIECGVEGAFFDVKDIGGALFDAAGDGVPVEGPGGERAEDEHVERSRKELGGVWHGLSRLYIAWKGVEGQLAREVRSTSLP